MLPCVQHSMTAKHLVALGLLTSLTAIRGVCAGWSWRVDTHLRNRLSRYFVKAELEEAMHSIRDVLQRLDLNVRNDLKWSWATDSVPSALVNLLILNTVHERAVALQAPPKEGLKANLLPEDEAIGTEAARYSRFASAAYGIFMLKGASVMSWDSGWPHIKRFSHKELTSWCITKHCGIASDDIVKINLLEERKLHLPGYFLAVDHATRSVVLSVRGTFSIQDTITDLVCDSSEFMGGSCHRGLRQGAEALLQDASCTIVELLKRHDGYRLVLCGHSLGGGISTLLTMMIMKRRRELGMRRNTEVLCYAFGPPPVFGPLEKMPADTRKAIRSFVFGNDLVSRLSLASAYELFRDLKQVDAIESSVPQRCKYLLRERRPRLRIDDDGRGDVAMRLTVRYATALRRMRFVGGEGGGGSTSRGGGRDMKGWGGRRGQQQQHEVQMDRTESFIQDKLEEDFTPGGKATSWGQARSRPRRQSVSGLGTREERGGTGDTDELERARHCFDRYDQLMIPGRVFHLRKLGAHTGAVRAAAAGADSGESGGKPLRECRWQPLYWMEREPPEEFAKLLLVDTAIVDHLPKAYEDALHALYGSGLPVY